MSRSRSGPLLNRRAGVATSASLASSLALLWPLALQAAPMKPLVLSDVCPWVQPSVSGEQAHLQSASQRYSDEVPRDDDLPMQFRKTEAPKGAPLLNIGF